MTASGTIRALSALSALSALLAMGCAHVPREAGFDDVERLVSERIGQRPSWSPSTPEDPAAARAVEALLEEPLTADGAVQLALLRSPSLRAVYEELGVTQAEVVQAGLLSNLVLFGGARFPDRPPSGTNVELGLAQSFLDALMRPARRNLAEAQFEAVKLRVSDKVLDLAAEVEKAYYEVVGARQAVAVRRLIAAAAQASFEMAGRLRQAGNLSELGLARERDLYEEARLEVGRAEAARLAAREGLTRAMGLWGRDTAWEAPDRLPDLPASEPALEHLESVAIARRLDLAAAGRDVEALARALGIVRHWRWIAAADVGASAERETEGQWVVGPELQIELPIFDQGQARIARQQALLRQAEARLAALAVDVRSQVRALRDRLLMTRALAAHYRYVIIPLRERIVALTQQEYNYMLAGVFELLAAKRDEFDAYEDYIGAVRDYWVTRTELERAVGQRLPAAEPAEPAEPGTEPAAESEHRDHHHP